MNAPRPAAPARQGWETIHERNAHLAIRSEDLPRGWDGAPVDYGAVIHGLVRADRLL